MQSGIFRFRYLVLTVGVVYLVAFFQFARWNINLIGGGDSWGYYGYLPAAFIYGDLHDISDSYLKRFDYVDGAPRFPAPGGELPVADNGHRVIKYTCGVAMLQLPFFALGHAWAALDGRYVADGFSFPYVFLVSLGNLFYLLLGGYLLYLLLAARFNAKIACWTLLLLALGTNLFNFAVYRSAMSHAYLFSLYAGLMYAAWRFYAAPRRRWIVLAALCAGLITLIRPVEILCLAIPLTYGLTGVAAVRARLALWAEHWRELLLAAVIFVACGLPQLFYWKYATGHWRFDSYPNEAFDFANPEIYGGLFSTRNGWLVYAPIMGLSLLGILALLRRRDWLWPVLLILPAHVYIAYSWWCWYYINGFGSRPMVELYALLSIPLAYVLLFLNKRRWTTYFAVFLSVAAIGLQLFQNWQHAKGILWSEMANPAYYRAVFGKTAMTYDALVAFDSDETQPDSTRLKPVKTLAEYDFETPDSVRNVVTEPVFAGRAAWQLTAAAKYGNLYVGRLSEAGLAPGQWLRLAAWCYKKEKEFPAYAAPGLVAEFSRDGEIYKYAIVRVDSKLGNPEYNLWGGRADTWGYVRLWVQVPENIQPEDVIKIYFMAQVHDVFIDDAAVEIWRGK